MTVYISARWPHWCTTSMERVQTVGFNNYYFWHQVSDIQKYQNSPTILDQWSSIHILHTQSPTVLNIKYWDLKKWAWLLSVFCKRAVYMWKHLFWLLFICDKWLLILELLVLLVLIIMLREVSTINTCKQNSYPHFVYRNIIIIFLVEDSQKYIFFSIKKISH